jgi:hypothetical protein
MQNGRITANVPIDFRRLQWLFGAVPGSFGRTVAMAIPFRRLTRLWPKQPQRP